jgi:hypothetical protein
MGNQTYIEWIQEIERKSGIPWYELTDLNLDLVRLYAEKTSAEAVKLMALNRTKDQSKKIRLTFFNVEV